MNLLIDFSQEEYVRAAQLYHIGNINQITFIIPFFIFLQTNFAPLLEYMVFLKQNVLINAKVKHTISQQQKKQLQKYNTISVRGTFDRLHIGHRLLLLNAIYSAKQELIIQIKGDMLMQNKRLKQMIQPFQVRKKVIQQFIENIKPQLKVKIVQITQIYGNAPNSKSIQAILVSQESVFSSKHINKLRKQNGLKKIAVIVMPVITSNNQTKQLRVQHKISSRKIRQSILAANNFTIQQYLAYKNIWDYLVNEINTLCDIKDPDFVKAYRWFEKVTIYHLVNSTTTNRQIFQKITKFSSPQHQSLAQIAHNLKLFLKGVKTQKESQLRGVCKQFLQNLFKKKTKICKRIIKMILKQLQSILKEQKRKKIVQKGQKSKSDQWINNQTNKRSNSSQAFQQYQTTSINESNSLQINQRQKLIVNEL